MVEARTWTADKGDVVGGVGARQPRGGLNRAVGADHHLFNQIELQHFAHELGVVSHVVDAGFGVEFAHQQHMVEPVCACAVDGIGPRIGVGGAHFGAHVLFHGIEAHFMATGQMELQHAASGRQTALGQHHGFDAIRLDLALQCVQVSVLTNFVSHMVHTGLVRGLQDDRVLVPFVPALQVHVAVFVFHGFDHAHYFFVVLHGSCHVHHFEGHMPNSHHTHLSLLVFLKLQFGLFAQTHGKTVFQICQPPPT